MNTFILSYNHSSLIIFSYLFSVYITSLFESMIAGKLEKTPNISVTVSEDCLNLTPLPTCLNTKINKINRSPSGRLKILNTELRNPHKDKTVAKKDRKEVKHLNTIHKEHESFIIMNSNIG